MRLELHMLKHIFLAVLISLFAVASQAGAQPGGKPPTGTAKPADKPTVTPKKTRQTLDNLNTDTKNINASEGSTAQAMRGIMSSPGENPGGEKDDPFVSAKRSTSMLGIRVANITSYKSSEISRDPKSQEYLMAIKSALGGFEVRTALLAEHKYMINECLAIKVSAGEFSLKVPDPDVRIDATGIAVTFSVPHVEMSAVKFRFRPDLTDTQQPCHFSGKVGIGASADNLRLELHFDPILNVEQCKIASLGEVSTVWRIGHLRMSPVPPEVMDLGGSIVEDALNFGTIFHIVDRIVVGLNGAANVQCHK
jgi:hypothetical protein